MEILSNDMVRDPGLLIPAVNRFLRRALLIFLVALPVSPSAYSADLVLRGMAEFTELRRPFYIAAYYSADGLTDPQQILASQGTRRMAIAVQAERWTPRRFSSQWTQLLLVNADQALLNRFDGEFVRFINLAQGPLLRGDTLVIDSDDQGHTTVLLNGVEALRVERPGFFELLLSAWIGARPPSSEFKRDILADGGQQLADEFGILEPNNDRIAVTAGWLGVTISSPAAEPAPEEAPAEDAGAVAATTADEPAAAPAAEPAAETPAAPAPVVPAAVPDTAKATDKATPKPAPESAVADVDATVEAEAEDAALEQEMDPELYRQQQEMLLKLYSSSVIKQILRQVQYPRRAVSRNQQGTVMLQVEVARDGNVQSVATLEETKYALLNKAALEALENAGTLPPLPAGLDDDLLTITIPVRFVLN